MEGVKESKEYMGRMTPLGCYVYRLKDRHQHSKITKKGVLNDNVCMSAILRKEFISGHGFWTWGRGGTLYHNYCRFKGDKFRQDKLQKRKSIDVFSAILYYHILEGAWRNSCVHSLRTTATCGAQNKFNFGHCNAM